ncbi:methyltransferase domain-containing protein [Azospirillum rugosum]|uniref:SAM-dependent methyltransferase n=1 Tax=Azospirillum rugosum TaxID=416170 RepID=A0ABS4SPC4_9PROT|nr:methyltransferase domain-containing protein [Azospirillum rugosum]MBP2294403.1 SAM-dependent methyltransferase [Azospirillum rugosum]MDQ0527738.1 SAM-dependent methyltransferase [Azospirillum rugosum]
MRHVIRQMDIPVREVGGFHDWPSRIAMVEEQQRKLKFCFIRHPLEWLRSLWMHEMYFGWEDNHFSRSTASDNFAEFLRNAIRAFPEGPVSAAYAPFLKECDAVGRQENLIGDMLTILGRAREDFVPGVLYRTGNVGIGIPEEFRRAAVAPEDLLREVLASDAALCKAWGYDGVPSAMIGEPATMTAAYVPLVPCPSAPAVDAGDGMAGDSAELADGPTFDNAFRIGDRLVPGRKEFRRTTKILRDFLDTLDFTGRTVLDTACGDGVFAQYAAGRGAERVVAIDRTVKEAAVTLDRLIGRGVALREEGLYGLDAVLGERFDVVFCFRQLETLRYPFLALRALSRLVKEGGTLVLECGYLDAMADKPLLMCPLGSEAPASALECSYFNRKGLLDSLASFGFTDIGVVSTFQHGLDPGRDFSALNFENKAEWNDSETVIGRLLLTCRWEPGKAEADPRLKHETERLPLLLDRWDSQLPFGGVPAHTVDPQLVRELYGAIFALQEEVKTCKAQVQGLEVGIKDRERDLQEAWMQRDALGRDLVERTEELVATREELRDRTLRLEQALTALEELRRPTGEPPASDA